MSPGSPTPRDVEAQLAVFKRGVVDLIEERELAERIERSLKTGKPLRVKFGMDPSSPDLHVGHAIPLMKLRAIQELGHTIVLIVGDATAMVGDPSGRNKLRPQLTREEVESNLQTYVEQVKKVVDVSKAEVRRNSEWFDGFRFQDFLRLAGRMTVARMIERDTFQKRMKENEPIGIHEMIYPLMQGWDSVMIHCDLELGGTDQLFNLLRGRDLQREEGQEGQICFTTPLINGLDGRKMSKSYGNSIGLTDEPREMFINTMRIQDDAMRDWYTLLTRVPIEEVERRLAGDLRDAKAELATEITAFFHSRDLARAAREAFDLQFRDHKAPDDLPVASWPKAAHEEGLGLANLLKEIGLEKSTSDARRNIEQGGVKFDGQVEVDPKRIVHSQSKDLLIQIGRRRWVRLASALAVSLGSNVFVGTTGKFLDATAVVPKEFLRLRMGENAQYPEGIVIIDCDIKDSTGRHNVRVRENIADADSPDIHVLATGKAVEVRLTGGALVIKVERVDRDSPVLPNWPLIRSAVSKFQGVILEVTGEFCVGTQRLSVTRERLNVGNVSLSGNVFIQTGGLYLRPNGIGF
ncbi:MAG TPA: tyrosine--tRNA ligase [Planctomycetota bacterium]|jgi:tyrosyl-tRNA synthetase|nr:tyrosine--tRNA ligase [Planctomycetota bacterium]